MKSGELQLTILGMLVAHGPVHVTFLMDELGSARRTIEITAGKLIAQGFACRPVKATYSATTKGVREVERMRSLLAGDLA